MTLSLWTILMTKYDFHETYSWYVAAITSLLVSFF